MLFFSRLTRKVFISFAFAFLMCQVILAQSSGTKSVNNGEVVQTITVLPKVTQIDIEGLKKLIKPTGKPLLINFWATWCDPCREEFPDLVKIDTAYRGKIDFFTVSLDDLADINTYVPKFLAEMKAEMPAFLLKTPDESAAITMVAADWNGNLPMTILITATGETAYIRKGKIRNEAVTSEIKKLLAPDPVK